jgi:phosphoglycerate dehydrogenase-like enzyme
MPARQPVLVVEDDVWARLIGVVLDPATPEERRAAFADFMSPDLPDFRGWCDEVRRAAGPLFPSEVRLVSSTPQLRDSLASAEAVVTEALPIGAQELALAPHLKAVHKYGMLFRNIDVAACTARGVKVFGVRRRANISCAEHAFALMLALSRQMHKLTGLISVAQLAGRGRDYKPFDRRYTPGANWGRFAGTRALNGSTIGIIGLGEIGREIALRAAAFGMTVLYFQRSKLSAADEASLKATHRPLESLLASSDWVIPQLPLDASTFHLLNRERLALLKPGACIVNVSRAEIIDRDALLEALRSGHLGGFALDVQYEEPGRADDELLAFDNVVLTPHMAGSPRQNGLRDIAEVIENLARALAA